ncbi:MAG: GNAT family N-acetyltransferase [Candidatus Hodarchaeales archaeon]
MKNRSVILKDGREVQIRSLLVKDEKRLFQMFNSMSEEALRWGMPPYTKEVINRWMSNIDSMIPLVAELKQRIVGFALIFKNPHPRRMGTGSLAMYLHQDFHNVGLGSFMLELLLKLAHQEKLHRVGLHVIADNKIAVYLYKKFGFKVEGVMKDSYLGADGEFHDELVMGKLLKHEEDS